MPRIQFRDVEFEYSGGFRVESIDLSIEEGEFIGIIGPNGSGKSTVLRLMSRGLQPRSGRILLDSTELSSLKVRDLARVMAMIPSENYFDFPFPVREVVAMGRHPHQTLFARLSSIDKKIIERSMQLTAVADLAGRPISELSSGERQRVLLARALAQAPRLLLLDEPNAHLDIHHQIEIFRLLRDLQENDGLTVVTVLHDLNSAAVFCDKLVLMNAGKVVANGPPGEVLRTDLIRSTYGADVEVHPGPHGFPIVSFQRAPGREVTD